MARSAAFPGLPVLAFVLATAAPAGAGEDRRHWDWGQHRTSLAEDGPRLRPLPAPRWDHWDDPGAPVRFAAIPPR